MLDWCVEWVRSRWNGDVDGVILAIGGNSGSGKGHLLKAIVAEVGDECVVIKAPICDSTLRVSADCNIWPPFVNAIREAEKCLGKKVLIVVQILSRLIYTNRDSAIDCDERIASHNVNKSGEFSIRLGDALRAFLNFCRRRANNSATAAILAGDSDLPGQLQKICGELSGDDLQLFAEWRTMPPVNFARAREILFSMLGLPIPTAESSAGRAVPGCTSGKHSARLAEWDGESDCLANPACWDSLLLRSLLNDKNCWQIQSIARCIQSEAHVLALPNAKVRLSQLPLWNFSLPKLEDFKIYHPPFYRGTSSICPLDTKDKSPALGFASWCEIGHEVGQILDHVGTPGRQHGLLLIGPGRSRFAQVIAEHLARPYVVITSAEILQSLVGGTERVLSRIADYWTQCPNLVLIFRDFDEILAPPASNLPATSASTSTLMVKCFKDLLDSFIVKGIRFDEAQPETHPLIIGLISATGNPTSSNQLPASLQRHFSTVCLPSLTDSVRENPETVTRFLKLYLAGRMLPEELEFATSLSDPRTFANRVLTKWKHNASRVSGARFLILCVGEAGGCAAREGRSTITNEDLAVVLSKMN